MENKNTFFMISLDIKSNRNNEFYMDKLDNNCDLILHSMNVGNTLYRFNGPFSIVYIFKCEKRKRKGQLVKLCEKYLNEKQEFVVESLTKDNYERFIKKMKNSNLEMTEKPESSKYSGKDISILNDPKNWHDWQIHLYNRLFEKPFDRNKIDSRNKIKPGEERFILCYIDKVGNNGKSILSKWLLWNRSDEIAVIDQGSAQQIKSSVVNKGARKAYIIDLTRQRGQAYSEDDLLCVLESIKNGLVQRQMFGDGNTLIMDPPHLIVFTNEPFEYNKLSRDRWKVWNIKNKKAIKASITRENLKKNIKNIKKKPQPSLAN